MVTSRDSLKGRTRRTLAACYARLRRAACMRVWTTGLGYRSGLSLASLLSQIVDALLIRLHFSEARVQGSRVPWQRSSSRIVTFRPLQITVLFSFGILDSVRDNSNHSPVDND